jgi:hypothetical protein
VALALGPFLLLALRLGRTHSGERLLLFGLLLNLRRLIESRRKSRLVMRKIIDCKRFGKYNETKQEYNNQWTLNIVNKEATKQMKVSRKDGGARRNARDSP